SGGKRVKYEFIVYPRLVKELSRGRLQVRGERKCRAVVWLRLVLQQLPGGTQFLALRGIDLRVSQLKILQLIHDRRRPRQPGKPLVGRRNDIPGSVRARRVPDHVFVRFHVVVPTFALANVRRGELPVFLGMIQAIEKTLLLLFLRDIQKKLANDDS